MFKIDEDTLYKMMKRAEHEHDEVLKRFRATTYENAEEKRKAENDLYLTLGFYSGLSEAWVMGLMGGNNEKEL